MSAKTLEEMTIPELVRVYNELSSKPVKRFRTKTDGIVRIQKLQQASGVQKKPKKPRKTTAEREAAADARKGRPLKFSREATIEVNVAENPKRAGSAAHARFEIYRNGMTVGEALRKGVTPADIRWDAKQRFILIAQ